MKLADSHHIKTLPKLPVICASLVAYLVAVFWLPAFADTVTNLVYPQPQGGHYAAYGSPTITTAYDTLPDLTTGQVAVFTAVGSQVAGIVPPARVVPIMAGQVYTCSYYTKWAGGAQTARIMVNPQVFGGSGNWVGIEYNPVTGMVIGQDYGYPGTYIVSQVVGNPSWIVAALTFKATSNNMASCASASVSSGTKIEVWGADFIQSPYKARHIDTNNAPALGENQLLPDQDDLSTSNWTGSRLIALAGRQGDPNTHLWKTTDAIGYRSPSYPRVTNPSFNYNLSASNVPFVQYAYVPKTQYGYPEIVYFTSRGNDANGQDQMFGPGFLTLSTETPQTLSSITWAYERIDNIAACSSPSVGAFCGTTIGIIDAGDMFLIYNSGYTRTLKETQLYDIHFVYSSSGPEGPVAIGRLGIQGGLGSIFP